MLIMTKQARSGSVCRVAASSNTNCNTPDDRYPVIGNNVTLYTGAKILGPRRIGDKAVVGANAVVFCDVPAGRLAIGVSSRVVSLKEAA